MPDFDEVFELFADLPDEVLLEDLPDVFFAAGLASADVWLLCLVVVAPATGETPVSRAARSDDTTRWRKALNFGGQAGIGFWRTSEEPDSSACHASGFPATAVGFVAKGIAAASERAA